MVQKQPDVAQTTNVDKIYMYMSGEISEGIITVISAVVVSPPAKILYETL